MLITEGPSSQQRKVGSAEFNDPAFLLQSNTAEKHWVGRVWASSFVIRVICIGGPDFLSFF
jgi:hypothetical protein